MEATDSDGSSPRVADVVGEEPVVSPLRRLLRAGKRSAAAAAAARRGASFTILAVS